MCKQQRHICREDPRSQSAQVQERQHGKLINALDFIENANANERDANICTNLILCFVPFSFSQRFTGKFAAFYTLARQTTEWEVMLLMSINHFLREGDISAG